MTYYDTWQRELPDTLNEFARLAEKQKDVDLIFGLTAAAVLWGIRNAHDSEEHLSALAAACDNNDDHIKAIRRAVAGWDLFTPLEAVEALNKRQVRFPDLRPSLSYVMGKFVGILLEHKMLKVDTPSNVHIEGNVTGGNIVINGIQYIVGDVVINYYKIRFCPTAKNPQTPFVGRREEIAVLRSLLLREKRNSEVDRPIEAVPVIGITGLHGMGGIGKTMLALQLAQEMRNEFPAVLWAELGPQPVVMNLLASWARHSDPDFQPKSDDPSLIANEVRSSLTDLIRQHCAGKVLVILDDVWEGDSVRIARILLDAVPSNAAILITTRSQLVAAQLRCNRVDISPFSPSDALSLLRARLQKYPQISDAVLLDMANVLGYHPLALDLAAGYVNTRERPAEDIVQVVEGYRRGIPPGSPFPEIGLKLGTDRQDNLELVLSYSYSVLDSPNQACFRALGVGAYGAAFDTTLCGALWGFEPEASIEVLRLGAMLVIDEPRGWYRQHALLRAYARGLLEKSGELKVLQERLLQYGVKTASVLERLELSCWREIERFFPQIEAAGQEMSALMQAWLNARHLSIEELASPQGTPAFVEVPKPKNVWGNLIRLGQKQTKPQPDLDDWINWAAVYGMAVHRYVNNRHVLQGKEWLLASLAAVRIRQANTGYFARAGLKELEQILLKAVGEWFDNRGNSEDALRYLGQSPTADIEVELLIAGAAERAGNLQRSRKAKARAFGVMVGQRFMRESRGQNTEYDLDPGFIYDINSTDSRTRKSTYEKFLQTARFQGDELAQAVAHLGLSRELMLEEAFDQVEAHLRSCEDVAERFADKLLLARTRMFFGCLRLSEQRYDEARQFIEASISLYQEIHFAEGESQARVLMVMIHTANDDLSSALTTAMQIVTDFHRMGAWLNKAEAQLQLAFLHLEAKQIAEAVIMTQEVVATLDYTDVLILEGNVPRSQQLIDRLTEIIESLLYDELLDDTKSAQLVRLLQATIQVCRKLKRTETELFVMRVLANLYLQFGEQQLAFKTLQEARVIAVREHKPKLEADVLNAFGIHFHNIGDPAKSVTWLLQALKLAEKEKHRELQPSILTNLALAYSDLGQIQNGESALQRALQVVNQDQDDMAEAGIQNACARLLRLKGETQSAIVCYERAAAIYAKYHFEIPEAEMLNNIGEICVHLGQVEKAFSSLEKAYEVFRRFNDRAAEAVVICNIGMAFQSVGLAARAVPYYEKALQLQRELHNRAEEATILLNLGTLLLQVRQFEASLQYSLAALSIIQEQKLRLREGIILNNVGQAYLKLGRIDEAYEYFTASLTVVRQVQDRLNEATVLDSLGLVWQLKKNNEQAIHFHVQALQLAQQIRSLPHEAASLFNIGVLLRKSGKIAEAINGFSRALVICQSTRNVNLGSAVMTEYSLALFQIGQRENAIALIDETIKTLNSSQLSHTGNGFNINQLNQLRSSMNSGNLGEEQ